MDKKQAEHIADALMSDHRAALAAEGEQKRARDQRAVVQRRIGAGGLVGLAAGVLIGHFLVGEWFAAGFIGLGVGALTGRLAGNRGHMND